MAYIHNIILPGHKNEWNLTVSDNIAGPRRHYAKLDKSDRKRQIPCDFTYLWNLMTKISEQTKQKQSPRYREWIDGCQVRCELGG